MRTALKVITLGLIILESGFASYCFFTVLEESLIAALITLAIMIVAMAPLIAIRMLLSEVEILEVKVDYLENEIRRKKMEDTPPIFNKVPVAQKGRKAITSWTCAKCGTVNKANTSNCENCGSAY